MISNMQFDFDVFERYEIPTVVLANPNFQQLYIIKEPLDFQASIRFNSDSELSFYVNKTEHTEFFFDSIQKKRLIHVRGFGWFIINKVDFSTQGGAPRKLVSCVSYEVTLAAKPTNIAAGTYVLYNPAAPEGTLLTELLKNNLTWRLGYVSPNLYGKARTFEMPNTNIYYFLRNDVAEAFECIFLFDNEELTINAYTVDELVKDSGVVMRFDTIMKNISIKDTTDSMVTALSVYGASDFSIAHVNPLGTSTIYDFTYVKDLMSPGLWESIQTWQAKVDEATEGYASTLTTLKDENTALLKIKSDLAKIQFILESAKEIQDISTPYTLQGNSNNAANGLRTWVNNSDVATLKQTILAATAYPAISLFSPYIESVAEKDRGIVQALLNIWACEKVITVQSAAIPEKEAQIAALQSSLSTVNDSLSFINNFTEEERKELEAFIFGTDWTNDYCVITDSMSYAEQQEIGLDLMAQGKSLLRRTAQPIQSFELEAVNYLFLKRFKGFVDKTRLGYLVHAKLDDDYWFTPILLEVNLNWSKPKEFSMKFGNRYRLQTSEYTWSDLINEISVVSSSVSSEFSKLAEPIRNGTINAVTQIMNNAWDSALHAVLAGDHQSMTLDKHGFTGRVAILDANGNITGTYGPEQFRMLNNLLVFTDDNWQNCKLALGKIDLGNGRFAYGLAAEVIIGTLLAGNNLVITNEAGTFKFDETGATLTNATLIINSTNGKARIYMDAQNGFKIQTWNASLNRFEDKLYIDTNGTLVTKGIITAESGNIGAWIIQSAAQGGGLQDVSGAIFLRPSGVAATVLGAVRQSIVFKAGNNFGVDAAGKVYAQNVEFEGGTFRNISSAYGNIRANALEANTVNASHIQAGSIAAGHIQANAISAGHIQAGAITVDKLAAGAIQTNYLNAATGTFRELSAVDGAVYFGRYGIRISGIQIGAAPDAGYSQVSILPPSNNNGNVGSGDLRWNQVVATNLYGTVQGSSMRKLKTDIRPFSADIIEKLEPIYFTYIDDPEQRVQLGFIADDVLKVCPELVGELQLDNPKDTILTLAYDRFCVVLVDEAQRQRKRIEALETENAELKERLARIEQRLAAAGL